MPQHVCEYVFVCWHYGYLILLFLDEHKYRYQFDHFGVSARTTTFIRGT